MSVSGLTLTEIIIMIALGMQEFTYFEVFSWCAGIEAEAVLERDNSNWHQKTCSNMVLSELCVIQGWQNIVGSLECTKEAAWYLSRYCISDHMGICRYCWTQVTKFGWRVYRGLCALLNSSSSGIIKMFVARESNDRCWRNHTLAADFWKGAP